jgi:hypothetical protein
VEYHPAKPEAKKSKSSVRRFIFSTALAVLMLCVLVADNRRSLASPSAELTVEQISDFDFDQTNGIRSDIPAKFRALDGKRISLVGWMWAPQASEDGVHDFQLVNLNRSDFKPPAAQEFISCHLNEPVPYVDGKLRASGTLRINIVHDASNGVIRSVISLDVDELKLLEEYPAHPDMDDGPSVLSIY